MTQQLKITAQFEYSGLPDYWGGNGARWADDHACVFAYYGPASTLRELIDEWARDDTDQQGKALFESDAISDAMIESALLEMLTDQGRAELDQIADFARFYGETNGHDYDFAGDDDARECACCAQGGSDGPFAVVMLAIICDTCGDDAEDCECEPAPEPVNADDDHALGAPVSGPHAHSGPHGRYTHTHPADSGEWKPDPIEYGFAPELINPIPGIDF